MEYICEYCGKQCKSNISLAQHRIWCSQNPNHKDHPSNTSLDDLCEEDKQLLGHYQHLYPEKYNEIYKEEKLKYNDQGYKKYDIAKLAKKDTLSRLIKIDEPVQIQNGVWSCPICGLHIKDMDTHVRKIHHLSWENFTKEYSWSESKIFYTEEHCKNLSKNKLNFYNGTQQGKKLKEIQSAKMSGNLNPATRDDVKLKISKSRTGQHMTSSNKYKISKSTTGGLYSENAHSFGYVFWAIHDEKELRFRSKTEYLIFIMLQYYNIPFEYEPYKIEYIDEKFDYPRHYIVDFISGNRLFEIKPNETDFSSDRKYQLVQKQLDKVNKKLEVVTPQTFTKVFDIDKEKPLSFFNNQIIENIKNGECSIKLPILHEEEFYLNSPFMKKLGNDPKEILTKGKLLYENKKNCLDCK